MVAEWYASRQETQSKLESERWDGVMCIHSKQSMHMTMTIAMGLEGSLLAIIRHLSTS